MEKKFTLSGRVASIGEGFVKGIARIINNEAELDKIQAGDIMIAAQTDINFVPAMEQCVGLVTEQGGRFCHAAIYSRENYLPCITDVENARQIITDGAEIILNTHKNTISLA
jgi:pyruvate,water dikinase